MPIQFSISADTTDELDHLFMLLGRQPRNIMRGSDTLQVPVSSTDTAILQPGEKGPVGKIIDELREERLEAIANRPPLPAVPEPDAAPRPTRTRRNHAQIEADEAAKKAAKEASLQTLAEEGQNFDETPAQNEASGAKQENPTPAPADTPAPTPEVTAPEPAPTTASPSDGPLDLQTLMDTAKQLTTFIPNDKTGAVLTKHGVAHDANDLLPIPRKLITPILRHLDATKLSEIPADKRAWTKALIDEVVAAK